MAFTYRAAGTLASGNNATSLSPALPAGLAAGDLLVCQFQCFGGTDSRAPSLPSDWEVIAIWANGTSRHGLWWKVATASESGPTLTLTGTGVASDTQLARLLAFTPGAGTTPVKSVTGTTSTNSSADNIGPVSGITPGSGDLVLLSCGKANDFNGTAALTSWTLAQMSESTTGNDAGMALLYQLSSGGGATGNLTVDDNGGTAAAGVGLGVLVSFDEYSPASQTLADTATLTDGTGGEYIALPQADTATLTDALTETLGGAAADETLADTATLTDAVAWLLGLPPLTLADTATTSDSLTRTVTVPGAALADTATVTDAVTPTLEAPGGSTLVDTATLTDAVGAVLAMAPLVDTVAVTDQAHLAWERSALAEYAAFSDTLIATLSGVLLTQTLSDTATVTDGLGGAFRPGPHQDTATLTDALTATLLAGGVHRDEAVQETATTSDQLVRALGVPLTDTVTVEDPAGFDLDFPPPADTVTVTDLLVATLADGAAAAESLAEVVAVTDQLVAQLGMVVVLAETATLSDGTDPAAPGVALADSATLTDQLDYARGDTEALTDVASWTDALTETVASGGVHRLETLSEVVTVTEVMALTDLHQAPILPDTLQVIDQLLASLVAPSEFEIEDLSGARLLVEDQSGPTLLLEER